MLTKAPIAYVWNSVEVLGADGLFQLGKVIDCAEGGLIVDFECCAMAPQFVPFGQLYRSSRPIILDKEHMRTPSPSGKRIFDALMRASPEEPWKWYEATMLWCDSELSFGLITTHTTWRRIILTGVVSGYMIRERLVETALTAGRLERVFTKGRQQRFLLLVEYGSFTKKSTTISIPKEHGAFADVDELHSNANSDAGKRLMNWFNQHSKRVKATGILGTEHFGSSCGVTFGILVYGSNWTIPSNLMKNTSNIPDASENGHSGMGEKDDDGKLRFVPFSILSEVFGSISTVEQTRLRRVCSSWNSVLTQPEISRVICVCLDGVSDDYANAVCLYKTWNQHNTVVIAGLGTSMTSSTSQSARIRSIFRFLRYLNKSTADHLEQLIIGNACWEVEVDEWSGNFQATIDAFGEELKNLSAMYRNLILRNVTITLKPEFPFPDDNHQMNEEHALLYRNAHVIVHVAAAKVNVGGMSASEWWAKFDNGMPRLTAAAIQRVHAWIDDIMQWDYVECRRWEITVLLHMMQTGDPRDCVAYQGKSWSRDKQDGAKKGHANYMMRDRLALESLDVNTLSRLTLHSLLNRLDKQPYRLRVELSL